MQKYFVLTKFFRMFLFKILTTFKKLFTISKKCFRFKNCLQFSKNVHEFLNIFVLYFLHVFNFCSHIQKMFVLPNLFGIFQICSLFQNLFSGFGNLLEGSWTIFYFHSFSFSLLCFLFLFVFWKIKSSYFQKGLWIQKMFMVWKLFRKW